MIETIDLDGAALASIKGLAKMVREQAEEIKRLKAQVSAMSDDFVRVEV